MARQKQKLRPTRKHIARAEHERILRNRIIAGTLNTAILVFGLIGFGVYQQYVIVPREPIAVVDGEEISTGDFQSRVVYEVQYGGTAQQVAPAVLDNMINGVLIRHEAENLGIEISEAELNHRIEELFGYYRDGTPTRSPSSTPNPTQNALATLTAAAAVDDVDVTPTIAYTATPRPTPTEYTQEGFEQFYSDYISDVKNQSGLSEEQFRQIILTNLLSQKIKKILEPDVSRNGEKTELRHILTYSEETAQEVRSKLDNGEAWEGLVLEYSQDATTQENGGELGWLTRGTILAGFGVSVELLVTESVGTLVGPIQTTQGWHVFEIIDRQLQPLTEYEYQQAVDLAYNDWLLELRSNAEIVIYEGWYERIPDVEAPQSGLY